ncbi:variant leucine-rich repeat-containing protein [Boudabousia liubingyangii]|uniref:variant leucine-rich repeat-containing protein n=1 Tax=Boudabousia liubingyangii TaxID=1921764 RepID=UPI001177DBAC|nr:hypothetical protein [Boudabousia liubingyangii]
MNQPPNTGTPMNYSSPSDPTTALLNNPNLDPAILGQVAAARADLWPLIAQHPAAYPELLQYLAANGDPQTAQIAASRLQSNNGHVGNQSGVLNQGNVGNHANEPKPKKRKPWLIALVSVLLLAMVGTGSYFGYTYFSGDDQKAPSAKQVKKTKPTKAAKKPLKKSEGKEQASTVEEEEKLDPNRNEITETDPAPSITKYSALSNDLVIHARQLAVLPDQLTKLKSRPHQSGTPGMPNDVLFTKDGQKVVFTYQDGFTVASISEDPEHPRVIFESPSNERYLAAAPRGNLLVTLNLNGQLGLRDKADPSQIIQSAQLDLAGIERCQFSEFKAGTREIHVACHGATGDKGFEVNLANGNVKTHPLWVTPVKRLQEYTGYPVYVAVPNGSNASVMRLSDNQKIMDISDATYAFGLSDGGIVVNYHPNGDKKRVFRKVIDPSGVTLYDGEFRRIAYDDWSTVDTKQLARNQAELNNSGMRTTYGGYAYVQKNGTWVFGKDFDGPIGDKFVFTNTGQIYPCSNISTAAKEGQCADDSGNVSAPAGNLPAWKSSVAPNTVGFWPYVGSNRVLIETPTGYEIWGL